MPQIQKISVITRIDNPKEIHILNNIRGFLQIKAPEMKLVKNFYLQGLSAEQANTVAKEILACPVTESYKINDGYFADFAHCIEIGDQPGVMNPEAVTIDEQVHKYNWSEYQAAAITHSYYFKTKMSAKDLDSIKNRVLMNSQIQMEITAPLTDLRVNLAGESCKTVPLRGLDDKGLMELSDYKLFLTLDEMRTIQAYYTKLGRDATDVELETIAQTWSEHCGHKTFKAKVLYDGVERTSMIGLIKAAEKAISHPDIISKFSDNSGVFRFAEADGEEYGICLKAETHNSPSGLDPYGGAMTGSGGVFRDIAGTGKGAKNISSVDIFCLGLPDQPLEEVLPGCLHPRRILTGVVDGVRDYGNRMGIPTVNGSFHFHKDFGPKPTVLVGADGLIPLKYAKKGVAAEGELVVSFGGKTGKDGIHGATFSSAEMTEHTSKMNSGAVQIGNAIEEKRMFDCLIEIRDLDIITAMTDCGAGGYSSALGEIGEKTGIKVWLDKIPLKYPGLSSYEKWISESQERMVALFKPADIATVEKICKKYNVEMAVIGEVTNTKHLEIYDNGELVCNLDMDFLHDGQPTETIVATSYEKTGLKDGEFYEEEIDYNAAVLDVISHPNIASKEPVIRQYDHGVQGTVVEGPLCGLKNDAPTGASILKPLHNSNAAVVLGHGLNPILNRIDSFHGPLWSFYEAVSNVVALGGNPDKTFMINNYIWPKPTATNLSDLYNCVLSVTEASKFFKMPIISGKDSLSSTYKNKDVFIEVPPVICMSARAVTDDYRKTVSPDFKKAGSPLLLVGDYSQAELGGSVFFDRLGQLGTKVPKIDMETAKEIYYAVYNAIREGKILSCTDVSEGGMITAAIEMAIGGKMGFNIVVADKVKMLFAEVPAAFVCEMRDLDAADELIAAKLAVQIGTVTNARRIVVNDFQNINLVDLPLEIAEQAWKEPFTKYFV